MTRNGEWIGSPQKSQHVLHHMEDLKRVSTFGGKPLQRGGNGEPAQKGSNTTNTWINYKEISIFGWDLPFSKRMLGNTRYVYDDKSATAWLDPPKDMEMGLAPWSNSYTLFLWHKI